MLRVPNQGRARAIARAAIVMLLAGSGADPTPAASSPATEQAGLVERASAMLQQGANGKDVVAMLEPLAYQSNGRAQLLLGSVYFDGKAMPRDIVQGYAWISVAATSLDPAVAKKAGEMLLAGGPMLSGGDLIQADQRATSIRSTIADRQYEQYGAGVRPFTTERPSSFSPWITFGAALVQLAPPTTSQTNPNVRLGCAAAANRGCSSQSQAVKGPRCTGRIVQPETGASSRPGDGTYMAVPHAPAELRQRGRSGTVVFVVHVDRSGWICSAAIAESSGEPSWDAEALSAVTLSRLKPATRQGEAVEALHMLAMSFGW